MSLPNIAQYGLFPVVVLLLVKPLGGYMMRVFTWAENLYRPGLRAGGTPDLPAHQHRCEPADECKALQVAFVLFSLEDHSCYTLPHACKLLPRYDHVHLTMPMTSDLTKHPISFSTILCGRPTWERRR